MSHYVISDVHGDSDRFHRMLDLIQFTKDDVLYIIGDVIDRGPDGVSLLQEIQKTHNMVMLLGNHEYMCLRYFHPNATLEDIHRWNRNGNEPTLAGFNRISKEERDQLLCYLSSLPTHLQISVNNKSFYLVHGFVGNNVHDEVWGRPELNARNPIDGTQLIIGHTMVHALGRSREERNAYEQEMKDRGEHLRILHAPGFTDIDCGCGHDVGIESLASLELETMKEFYIDI